MITNSVCKDIALCGEESFCTKARRRIVQLREEVFCETSREAVFEIIGYAASVCKVFRAIGSYVDKKTPLRKDIKFFLQSTKLLNVLLLPLTIKKEWKDIKELVCGKKSIATRVEALFKMVRDGYKIVGGVFTIIKMIQTAERVNAILRFVIPYYDLLDIPLDIVSIGLDSKSIYAHTKFQKELEVEETKSDRVKILSKKLECVCAEKVNSLSKRLFITKKVKFAEKIDEYKKALALPNPSEKTVDEVSNFMKNLSSRVRSMNRFEMVELAQNVVNLVMTVAILAIFAFQPIGLIVPIVFAASSLVLKVAKPIIFRHCLPMKI
jgi:hypothetical protein